MTAVKRLMDLSVAYTGLVIFFPVLIFVSIVLFFRMGRPIIFRQLRAGKDDKEFYVYKFRTMTNECNSKGELLPDSRRLTKLGRLLRATSIDEVPQLINIIKGDMSIVGPRPLPVEYLPRYTAEQRIRHSVKPGITGWVAVNYRGKDKSWDEKFAQDIWYVKNWSIGLDLKIIVLTFLVMLRKFTINRKGETTSLEYTGK